MLLPEAWSILGDTVAQEWEGERGGKFLSGSCPGPLRALRGGVRKQPHQCPHRVQLARGPSCLKIDFARTVAVGHVEAVAIVHSGTIVFRVHAAAAFGK